MNTFNNEKKIPIGKEIKILRLLLNMKQENFAKLMLVSRVTLSNLESAKELENVTDNILFRLYYITQKVIENPSKKYYVKNQASEIKKEIDKILENRINLINE